MFQRTPSALSSFEKAKRDVVLSLKRLPVVSWLYENRDVNHLLLVPPDLRTADPSLSLEMEMGQFGLAGATVLLSGRSPFFAPPPNKAWEAELHGFGWVRHLQAARSDRALQQTVELTDIWLANFQAQKGLAWEPDVAAQRLINWLSHSNFLLQEADEKRYMKFMLAIDDHMSFLAMTGRHAAAGIPRLLSLIATVLAGLCVANQERFLDAQVKLLCAELDKQILADGGHVSRNNSLLALILLDLLPLKQCFVSRNLTPPPGLVGAINRMLPMIHYMRLGDGLLSRFNGAGTTLPDTLSTAVAHDDGFNDPLTTADASHYFRLEHGNVVVLMDGGSAPPLPLSKQAHAGCLSFEMSSGTCPLIVNCGAAPPAYHTMANNARASVCHSTLTINNRSSAQFLHDASLQSDEASLIEGPEQVLAAYEQSDDQYQITGSHDGYLKQFGLVHHRLLSLSKDGYKLSGEDWIEMPAGTDAVKRGLGWPYAVHFHIHPDVQPARSSDGKSITLTLPDSQVWTFSANGAVVFLEESIFYADFAGPCQSVQMVIRGNCVGPVSISWTLSKHIETQTPDPSKVPSWLADNVIPLDPPERDDKDKSGATLDEQKDNRKDNKAEESDANKNKDRDKITDLVEDIEPNKETAPQKEKSSAVQKHTAHKDQPKRAAAKGKSSAKKKRRQARRRAAQNTDGSEQTKPKSLLDRLPTIEVDKASPPPLPSHMKDRDAGKKESFSLGDDDPSQQKPEQPSKNKKQKTEKTDKGSGRSGDKGDE